MTMRHLLLNVTTLILSFALLLAGNSLQFVVLGVRAGIEGFSIHAMGMITAAYFLGFAFGSLRCLDLIRSIGHIRTFAALASMISGVVLAHPLWPEPIAWIFFRFVIGFCFAGLYTVVESWLNAQAGNEFRGRILSIYAVAVFGGFAIGPMLAILGTAEGFFLFVLASMIVSFALVPVTMTRAAAPVTPEATERDRFTLRRFYKETPLGMIGILCVGSAQGAFVGLSPVFVQRAGLTAEDASFFLTAALLAGLICQFPVGWLSDRFDRRLVIAIAALVGGAGCAAFAAWTLSAPLTKELALLGALIVGAAIFPLYAIVIAYTNDWLDEDSIVSAAAALILTYSLGSAVASPLASFLMSQIGAGGLIAFIAAAMIALGLFAVARMFKREAPDSDYEGNMATYAASPGTLPIDPLLAEYETEETEAAVSDVAQDPEGAPAS